MHDSWQNQLPLYAAGLLPASEREALEQHLTTCEHCQRDVQLWHDVAQAVHDDVSRRVLRDAPPPLAVPPAHTEHQIHSLQRGNHRFANPAAENRNKSPVNTRAHPVPLKAVQRIAGIALTLMAVGATIALLVVFANAKLSPETAGVVSQFSGPTPAAPLTPIPIPTPSPTPEPEPVMLDLSDIRDELQTCLLYTSDAADE